VVPVIEELAIGRLLADGEVPSQRQEGDVTIIPVIEERLVMIKQRVLVKEVRIKAQSDEDAGSDRDGAPPAGGDRGVSSPIVSACTAPAPLIAGPKRPKRPHLPGPRYDGDEGARSRGSLCAAPLAFMHRSLPGRCHAACFGTWRKGRSEGVSDMSVTDGLIEEELHKIVASGADGATDRDDALIAEATRRARSRAGLTTTNAPSAEAMEHWETVLEEIRDEGKSEPEDERSATDEGVRAQLIP
jgi:hypothetical protein